jgi:hypothetical protein
VQGQPAEAPRNGDDPSVQNTQPAPEGGEAAAAPKKRRRRRRKPASAAASAEQTATPAEPEPATPSAD